LFQGRHPGIVRQVRFHPQLTALASVGAEKAVVVWPLGRKAEPAVIRLTEEKPNTVAWSSDGTTLAVGCTSGEVPLYTAEGKPVRTLPRVMEGNLGPIQVVRMRFLPGDKELVYGGVAASGWAGIIDVATGTRRVQFREHTNTVMAVNCSADGKLAVSS